VSWWRRGLLGLGVAVAIAVAVFALVLWRTGARAQARLDAAQVTLAQLRSALASGDIAAAARHLQNIQAQCASARRSTHGFAWTVAAAMPYAGRTPRAIERLTRAADELAHRTLPGLVAAAGIVEHDGLVAPGGRVDLGRLRQVGVLLDGADSTLTPVARQLRTSPRALVIGRVRHAGDRLRNEVRDLQTQLGDARQAVQLLPAMLGAEAPRRYFVALQNNAEARGTGGLVGAFSIVTADRGRLRVVHTGSDAELLSLMPSRSIVARSTDADFTALYGDDPALWQNSNMSPHFPYAATLWLRLWQQSTGQRLDGAIAVDPVAAGYLLAAAGPARLANGEWITARNVVAKTERDAYQRFTDNTARKAYLRDVAAGLFSSVFTAPHDRSGLVDATRRAAGEQRLLVYSAHPDEEQVLSHSSVSGTLPEQTGPFLEVVVNNAGPGKLDYYLRRSVTYTLGACSPRTRSSRVTVTLQSDAPSSGLTPYVVGPSQRLLVYVYLTAGAVPTSVSVDGQNARVFIGRERGHTAVELPVDLPPRHSRSIALGFVEPAGPGKAVVRTQPLVLPQATRVEQTAC
jgi:hypothetical protein